VLEKWLLDTNFSPFKKISQKEHKEFIDCIFTNKISLKEINLWNFAIENAEKIQA